MARLSKEEAVALFEAAIAAGEYPKELEQCPHCQEPLPIDLLGYKVAEARGAAEAASLCTQFAVMLPAEATEARQAALDLATAILANAGCLPGAEIKVEQAGPETRSWVQALTAKWPAGDPAPRQGPTPAGPAKVATVDNVKDIYCEGLMVGQDLGKKLGASQERADLIRELDEIRYAQDGREAEWTRHIIRLIHSRGEQRRDGEG